MHYLVTGGMGFIGSHLVEQLIMDGHDITIIDNFNTGKKENIKIITDKIRLIQGDIRDLKLLRNLVKNIDGIFHEAALVSVQESFEKPIEYHDVNVIGTENILKSANEFGIKVVYASSSSVYGNPTRIPIKEDDPKNPINPYAQSKLDDERLAMQYAGKGVQVIGLRYFNVFGERQSKEYAGVIKKFLKSVHDGNPPVIFGDGLQTRDFVYVKDIVKANIAAMQSDVKHGFFNVGTNSEVTILELAKFMIEIANLRNSPIHVPELQGDIRFSRADNSLAKKLLGWEPKENIKNWLKTIISNKKFDQVID